MVDETDLDHHTIFKLVCSQFGITSELTFAKMESTLRYCFRKRHKLECVKRPPPRETLKDAMKLDPESGRRSGEYKLIPGEKGGVLYEHKGFHYRKDLSRRRSNGITYLSCRFRKCK